VVLSPWAADCVCSAWNVDALVPVSTRMITDWIGLVES